MNRTCMVGALAVLMLLGGQLQANTILLQDGFEGVSASTSFPAGGDFDPVATTGVWSHVVENTQGQAAVVTSGAGLPTAFENSNYFAMNRNGSTTIELRSDLSTASQVTERLVMVEFAMNTSSALTGFGSEVALLNSQTSNTLNAPVFRLQFDPDDGLVKRKMGDGSWFATGITNFVAQSWNTVEIVADLDAQTYDLTVNGTGVTGLPFLTTQSQVQQLAYFARSQGASQNVYIDDVTVTTIPEPATLILLGSAVLVAFARKRK